MRSAASRLAGRVNWQSTVNRGGSQHIHRVPCSCDTVGEAVYPVIDSKRACTVDEYIFGNFKCLDCGHSFNEE